MSPEYCVSDLSLSTDTRRPNWPGIHATLSRSHLEVILGISVPRQLARRRGTPTSQSEPRLSESTAEATRPASTHRRGRSRSRSQPTTTAPAPCGADPRRLRLPHGGRCRRRDRWATLSLAPCASGRDRVVPTLAGGIEARSRAGATAAIETDLAALLGPRSNEAKT